MVMWFVAGMSLLVAGIVGQARVDTQMAQLHVARAKVVAAGDGAIHLMMADVVGGQAATAVSQNSYRIGELEVGVTLLPAAGLINLNTAPLDVLAGLFLVGGNLDQSEARSLAANVIRWRSASSSVKHKIKRRPGFDAIEDLLRIEGVNRTLLDAIRDFIVAGAAAQGSMDLSLVPGLLLGALEQNNPGGAQALKNSRLSPGAHNASPRKNKRNARLAGGSGVYRADALVRYGDQTWLRRRWVSAQPGPASSLPWRILRTEPPRVYGG
jgi:hypothetical protein